MSDSVARIKSTALHSIRKIWIQEPLHPEVPCPLVIFLDAELYRERIGTTPIIRRLVSERKISDAWFVFVSYHSFKARQRECLCYPPFATFIGEELKRWLERRHPETRNVTKRILIGLSLSGLPAVHVPSLYPDLFQNVICQSGSFWWKNCWVVHHYDRLKRLPGASFFLDVGDKETDESDGDVSQVTGVRAFRDALKRKRIPVVYKEFDGDHDAAGWRKTLSVELEWALPLASS